MRAFIRQWPAAIEGSQIRKSTSLFLHFLACSSVMPVVSVGKSIFLLPRALEPALRG
jgi:hypothetical protein